MIVVVSVVGTQDGADTCIIMSLFLVYDIVSVIIYYFVLVH